MSLIKKCKYVESLWGVCVCGKGGDVDQVCLIFPYPSIIKYSVADGDFVNVDSDDVNDNVDDTADNTVVVVVVVWR